jgi:isochorismate pyruvate lyase
MKSPADCASLDEVRAEIDRIDRAIIALMGERAGYVHAAARFKSSEADLDPDVIEKLYRDLVAYFIVRETEELRRQTPS